MIDDDIAINKNSNNPLQREDNKTYKNDDKKTKGIDQNYYNTANDI